MDTRAQGALMMAIGGVAIRLGLTGSALNYIKGTYVPLLIAAGVVTALLGVITLMEALRDGADHQHHDDDHPEGSASASADSHGHDHSRGPRIAWMLAAPLFAVLLIAPPPLGSFAANRQSGVIAPASSVWPPLPEAENGVVHLGLGDYAGRALYDPDLSLAGVRVALTGFVSDHTEDGFVLTRFALSCCAADGTAINVEIRTDDPPLPIDSWVTVEGRWSPRDGHVIGDLTADPPLLDAESVRPVAQPDEPYET